MTSSNLPPLIRMVENNHNPQMVKLRITMSGQLIQAMQTELSENGDLRRRMAECGIRSIALGGSASISIPRHAHDIDLYVIGPLDPADSEQGARRIDIMNEFFDHAVKRVRDHIRVVGVEGNPKPISAVQRVWFDGTFSPLRGTGSDWSVNEPIVPIHLPLKVDVNHDQKAKFLPLQAFAADLPVSPAGNVAFMKMDPRFVVLNKLSRLFDASTSGGMKATDIFDIAYMIKTKKFDPSDEQIRKLGIATLASKGALRKPVPLDFLVSRGRDEEARYLRYDFETSLSSELLSNYSDEDLAGMLQTVRDAVRQIYPIKLPDEALHQPVSFTQAVRLTAGEEAFICGVFEGASSGSGSPIARVQVEKLFDDDTQSVDPSILDAIRNDPGLAEQCRKTSENIRESALRRRD